MQLLSLRAEEVKSWVWRSVILSTESLTTNTALTWRGCVSVQESTAGCCMWMCWWGRWGNLQMSFNVNSLMWKVSRKHVSTAPPVWRESLWCHLHSYQGSPFQHKVSDVNVPSVGCFGCKWIIWQQFLSWFFWQNTQSFYIIWWWRREGNRAVGRPVRLREDRRGECPVHSDPVQSELSFFTCQNSVKAGHTHTHSHGSFGFSAGGPPPHRWCNPAGESLLCGQPHHVCHTQRHGHLHTQGRRGQPRSGERLWNDRGESSPRGPAA